MKKLFVITVLWVTGVILVQKHAIAHYIVHTTTTIDQTYYETVSYGGQNIQLIKKDQTKTHLSPLWADPAFAPRTNVEFADMLDGTLQDRFNKCYQKGITREMVLDKLIWNFNTFCSARFGYTISKDSIQQMIRMIRNNSKIETLSVPAGTFLVDGWNVTTTPCQFDYFVGPAYTNEMFLIYTDPDPQINERASIIRFDCGNDTPDAGGWYTSTKSTTPSPPPPTGDEYDYTQDQPPAPTETEVDTVIKYVTAPAENRGGNTYITNNYFQYPQVQEQPYVYYPETNYWRVEIGFSSYFCGHPYYDCGHYFCFQPAYCDGGYAYYSPCSNFGQAVYNTYNNYYTTYNTTNNYTTITTPLPPPGNPVGNGGFGGNTANGDQVITGSSVNNGNMVITGSSIVNGQTYRDNATKLEKNSISTSKQVITSVQNGTQVITGSSVSNGNQVLNGQSYKETQVTAIENKGNTLVSTPKQTISSGVINGNSYLSNTSSASNANPHISQGNNFQANSNGNVKTPMQSQVSSSTATSSVSSNEHYQQQSSAPTTYTKGNRPYQSGPPSQGSVNTYQNSSNYGMNNQNSSSKNTATNPGKYNNAASNGQTNGYQGQYKGQQNNGSSSYSYNNKPSVQSQNQSNTGYQKPTYNSKPGNTTQQNQSSVNNRPVVENNNNAQPPKVQNNHPQPKVTNNSQNNYSQPMVQKNSAPKQMPQSSKGSYNMPSQNHSGNNGGTPHFSGSMKGPK